ncbi:MAG: TonB-dependent receptor plug domain-containing protein [Armatimonadota bacterium]
MYLRRTFVLSAALLVLMAPLPGWADHEEPSIEVGVTFSATRTEALATDVAASVSSVSADEIERAQTVDMTELLQTLPGTHVTSNGGFGGAESILIRGASNNQTLVLIDGVPVNNPMLGGSDLSNLTLDGVGRVEVVKAPLTSLWGADAMAGVVQIFTAPGPQMDDEARLGAGNYSTSRAEFAWGTGEGEQGLGIAGSWLQTDGVRENSDYDGFTIVGRWDQPVAGGALTLTGRYYDYDLGVAGPTTFPTPTDRQNSTAAFASLGWVREGLSHRDTLRLGWWDQQIEYDYANFLGAPQRSVGEPGLFSAGWQHDFIGETNEITVGVEYRHQEGDFSDTSLGEYGAERDQIGAFAQFQCRPGPWRLVGALRWQDEDSFGSKTTWRVGATRLFDGGRWGLWSSYATGYRVPTFNELFFPGSGNADLQPETSTSWEVGVWNALESGDTLEVAYFHNDFEDLIEWREVQQFVWQPVNIADATTEGVELSVQRSIDDRWFERGSLTKLSWRTDGDPLLRRPDWSAGYALGYCSERTEAQLDFTFVGDRLDAVSFPAPSEVGGYYLLGLGASHELGRGLELWVRANNILDQQYEAAANYPSPEFNFVAGVATDL